MVFLGNEDSAAIAGHSAGDWGKVLGLRAVCLTDNTPFVTAISNDDSYQEIFRQQLGLFLRTDDVVIAYSGSGGSSNVLHGINYAKHWGNFTVGITGDYNGRGGGELAQIADLAIVVRSKSMEIIEDAHLVVVKLSMNSTKGKLYHKL